jgi:dTMP kinase
MDVLKNFIVFEGIDGSGTSTQIDMLKKKAQDAGKRFLFTAEPTTEVIGKFLRTILSGENCVDPGSAAFLFAADRHEHLYGKNGVVEALGTGKTVISDRYLFSSLAYQSIGCGRALPKMLNSRFPLPEVLLFFDIDPAASLTRIAGRKVTEIYEKQEFLEKTAAAYRRIIAGYEKQHTGMKIIRLNAAEPIKVIAELIWGQLQYF